MRNPGSAAYPGIERRPLGGGGGGGDAGSWLVLAAERVREPAGRSVFLSCFYSLPEAAGEFPGVEPGDSALSTGGCVTLKEQGGERRAAAPGTEAPSGLGAREAWHCTVPRIAQVLLGPHSLKRTEAFFAGVLR